MLLNKFYSSEYIFQTLLQAEEEGANVDLDSQRKGKCAVIKTSTRQVKPDVLSISR